MAQKVLRMGMCFRDIQKYFLVEEVGQISAL